MARSLRERSGVLSIETHYVFHRPGEKSQFLRKNGEKTIKMGTKGFGRACSLLPHTYFNFRLAIKLLILYML